MLLFWGHNKASWDQRFLCGFWYVHHTLVSSSAFAATRVLLHAAESPILPGLASFLIFIGDWREKMTFPLKRAWTLGILSDPFDVVFTLVDNDNIIKALWTWSKMIRVNCLGKYKPFLKSSCLPHRRFAASQWCYHVYSLSEISNSLLLVYLPPVFFIHLSTFKKKIYL